MPEIFNRCWIKLEGAQTFVVLPFVLNMLKLAFGSKAYSMHVQPHTSSPAAAEV